jgi:peptidyl-prolyl cis-trans isomerase C
MHRKSPLRAAGLVVLALTALIPAARAAATPIIFPDGAAALVNGKPIDEAVVNRALAPVAPAQRAEIRPGLIDHLVKNLLIDQHLIAKGYKVEKAEVDKRINEMRAELKKANRDFDKILADLKASEAELREHVTADLRWYKHASAAATDEELKRLFRSEKESFDGSTVRTQHILFSPLKDRTKDDQAIQKQLRKLRATIEKEVKDALGQLSQDLSEADREKERQRLLRETFAKYAKEKSDCPSKTKGGELSAFPKLGVMVAPFADAAFALKPYEMSDVVQTSFGYHLILCVERKAGREVKFDDVKEVAKETYFDRLHSSLAADLRKKAVIYVKPAKE